MLAEGMPRALRRAVSRNKVPNDLEPDLLFLASLLDPLVEKIKAIAPDLPEKAQKAREQIEPAAEKAYSVSRPVLLQQQCCLHNIPFPLLLPGVASAELLLAVFRDMKARGSLC